MGRAASQRNGGVAAGPIVVWGSVFALWVTVVRLITLFLLGEIDIGLVAAVLAAVPEQLLWGALLAFFALSSSLVVASVGRGLLLVVLAINAAAVYYETVFHRLPAAGVFFYLRDLGELGPSMTGRGPLLLLAAEVLLGFVLLELLRRALFGGRRSLLATARALQVMVVCMVLAAAVHLLVRGTSTVHPSRSRTPLSWLMESAVRRQGLVLDNGNVGPQSVLWMQQAMGHAQPFAAALSPFPLCAPGARGADRVVEARTSIILLVLESVATAELEASYQGQPVMPELADFAARHIYLPDIKAAGTKSGSVMPPLFCGLPPQTHDHLLHRVPLNTFQGFPEVLAEHGYRTAYLHGADLTWEFQRAFLQMIGIDEVFERDPRQSTPVYGWGYSDEEMLIRLRKWVEGSHAQAPEAPYFVALFTLSSHDPYDLPLEWPRVFKPKDTRSRHFESLAYLDHHLGRFLDWYEAVEAPRGTVLIMIGDHAPHLMNTVPSEHGPVFRFEVPMVISAPGRDGLYRRDWSQRRGAHHDLPATLMSLLGFAPLACDQGVDLLMDDATWPADRIVYSVGGEELEEIQLWAGAEHLLVDRLFRGVRRLSGAAASGFDGSSPQASDRVLRFLEILLPLNRHLMVADAYAPPVELQLEAAGPPLARVQRPFFVSHRGNIDPAGVAGENTLDAVGAALAAGFDAVEVDVHLSRDQVPVLVHDASFIDAHGRTRQISSLDLEQLRSEPALTPLATLEEALRSFPSASLVLETKPQPEFAEQLAVGEAVAALVRGEAGNRRVIVDSFSLVQVTATEPSCECEVGWDLPYGEQVDEDLLRAALLAGVHWIFVEHSVLSTDDIAAAHRLGLKVMAYTVNDPQQLQRLHPELPDGVITDRADLMSEFSTPSEE